MRHELLPLFCRMEFLTRIAKFGIVGFIGMCIDFFVTWLCKEKFRFNKYLANSLGFTCAVINNFILNLRWTFQASGNHTVSYFIRFVLFSLVGLGLNNLCVFIFNDKMKINFYVSKALAVACVFAWNFCSNNYFNFQV